MLKQTMPARKMMATVSWDRKQVLMVEFMQQGTAITSEVHFETLEKLHRTIQNKRQGMLTTGVVLLDINVYLHTVAHTQTF
jgi:NADH pyrophosphatase NudC (nudix superfamily)